MTLSAAEFRSLLDALRYMAWAGDLPDMSALDRANFRATPVSFVIAADEATVEMILRACVDAMPPNSAGASASTPTKW